MIFCLRGEEDDCVWVGEEFFLADGFGFFEDALGWKILFC